jgi:hypothetical protein
MAARSRTAKPKPSVAYSPELAVKLCDEMASGKSLGEVCEMAGMPDRHSVRRWVVENAEFRAQYEAARLWWAHAVAEEINELADQAQEVAEAAAKNGGNPNAAVAALRVQLENKRWLLSKILPQQYGDRQTTELVGAGGKDLIPEQPVDSKKLALALIGILNDGPGGKNDPAVLPPLSAMAPRTLLEDLSPASPEPEPEPVLDPVYDGIYEHGEPVRPVFDKLSGKIVRFAPKVGG